MGAVRELTGHGDHVVVGSCREASGTEREAIVGIVHGREEPTDILCRADNARQAQDLNRRVIGVNTHIDATFLAYGHDGLEEIFHIRTELRLVDTLVFGQQLMEELQRVFVALVEITADEALGLDDDVLHELVVTLGGACARQFIDFCQDVTSRAHPLREAETGPFLAGARALEDADVEVCKFGVGEVKVVGAVGVGMHEVCARPVEDGHEVVADRVYPFSSEVAQALLVDSNLLIAVGTAVFDGFGDGQTLYHAPAQPRGLDVFAEVAYLLARPDLAERYVVQGGDNAFDANLAEHSEGYLIVLSEPTPSEFHFFV